MGVATGQCSQETSEGTLDSGLLAHSPHAPETILSTKWRLKSGKHGGSPPSRLPVLAVCLLAPPPCPRHLLATPPGQGPWQRTPAQLCSGPLSSRASTPNALSFQSCFRSKLHVFSEAESQWPLSCGEGRADGNPHGKPPFWEKQGQACAGHLLLPSLLCNAVPLRAPSPEQRSPCHAGVTEVARGRSC